MVSGGSLAVNGPRVCLGLVCGSLLFLSCWLQAQETSAPPPEAPARAALLIPAAEEASVEPAVPLAQPVQGEELAGEAAFEPGYDGKPLDPTLPITLKILAPQPREIIDRQEVDVFFSLNNYHLAEGGNRLHIIVDNDPPIIKTDIPSPLTLKNLGQGGHTIRAMVVRPDGTMIQEPGCFVIVHFYVRKKDFQNYTDPKLPFLTLNLPMSDTIQMDEKDRLCFDFLIHNPPSDGSGSKIHYKLEGFEGFLEQSVGPVYLSKLPPGRHKLVVELFDGKGAPIFGVFNRVERIFDVQKVPKAMPYDPDMENMELLH
ncbi:MAG: hypothetical protein HC904_16820 [Blastochloris sp.]|nr:hypothetical protein [Blastochloris sp.]